MSWLGSLALTGRDFAMDKTTIEAIAQGVGLEKALGAFPDDVIAAANSAEKAMDRVRQASGTPSPSLEPWPPMVVRK